ncbi:hypothetical protein [Vogesella indigofera]|uniref:hypothetical protein n=1 Tax=Vogesella indigofera TaxID=45465 RepID=UPI00234E5673|nr:hypothetical protein [Vogesella indigofera]MDC7707172.1 hypothetical protein [Vogesella indigofera]
MKTIRNIKCFSIKTVLKQDDLMVGVAAEISRPRRRRRCDKRRAAANRHEPCAGHRIISMQGNGRFCGRNHVEGTSVDSANSQQRKYEHAVEAMRRRSRRIDYYRQ